MDYKIEVLDENDICSYKELIDEAFGGSNSLDQYRQYKQNENYTIWVIKDGSRIIGSVTQYAINLFTFGFQPSLMLFNVAVGKDDRQHGIAMQLLTFVIEKAKLDGFRSISLTCLDDAYPAHKLYERAGFQRTSSLKYSIDIS
jgi:predicted N-acetyltransferase YhbS